jgi:hypothetical protein
MATQSGHSHGPHNQIAGLTPLYHVIGSFAVFLMSLAFNGTLFLMCDFVSTDILKRIKHHRMSGLFATPTVLRNMEAFTVKQVPQLVRRADEDVGAGNYDAAKRECEIVLKLQSGNTSKLCSVRSSVLRSGNCDMRSHVGL